jgi:hypothetical protein
MDRLDLADDIAALEVTVQRLRLELGQARRAALLEAADLIRDRLREAARRGPPGAPGHACAHCKDSEAHAAMQALRDLARVR